MPVKSSFSLSDELHAAWKASGLTLPELVRRGLDENTVIRRITRAEARFATVEQRLAAIEQRLAQAEASGASTVSYADFDDELSDEEHERLRAEQHRQDINDRRALLLAKVPHATGEPVVVDVAAAVAAFGVSDQTARSWMKALAGYGYARQLDRKEGTGQRYEWVIDEPIIG
jgi:Maltoporin periplasmic N-terminal extension